MKQWERFMLESNRIEGEDRLNPGDEEAYNLAMSGIKKEKTLLTIHKILTSHLDVDWSGKYRKYDVRVGKWVPSHHRMVPAEMADYFKQLPLMHAWTAHNEFEKIHPFTDFNGRTGRLIWLSKTPNWEYVGIPFLQMYYYQTLEQYERINIEP